MKKGAILIESREIDNLREIIEDHLKLLPSDWGFNLYLSSKNYESVMNRGKFDRKIDLFQIPNAFGLKEYNEALTSVNFWKMLPYDKVLILQSDSMLLKPGIDDFLQWDYIGASWKSNKRFIGNGGLSIRSRDTMIEICDKFNYDGKTNEDYWICENMFNSGIGKLAPIEVADTFSVETKFILGSLGYHAIEKWLPQKQCELIKNQYKNNLIQ